MCFSARNQSAFTLVELSIVLIIIGLIISGILGGNVLIKAAQVRAAIKELTAYQTAVNAFVLKYDFKPGDLPTAYDFLGAPGGCTNADVNSTASGCNGNGNGVINTNFAEDMRSWQHLAVAGMISGTYPGTDPGGEPVAGVNIPPGSISNSAYHLDYFSSYGRSGDGFRIVRRGQFGNGVMKAETMRSLDVKMDDGIASSGLLFAYRGADYDSDGNCTTNSSAGTDYVVSDQVPDCRGYLFFRP